MKINRVVFKFPALCGTCEQEAYDNEQEEAHTEEARVTIENILEAGTPLCPVCDADLEVAEECEVLDN